MKRIEFKYHPNLYSDEILIHEEGVCNCCGRKVPEYIGTAYSPEDTDCICLFDLSHISTNLNLTIVLCASSN